MIETPVPSAIEEIRVRNISSPSKPQLLHEQLTALARHLGPGAKLPRVTELCQGFTVSSATLNRALQDLENDGLIVRRHGVGIYVADSVQVRKGGRILLVCEPSFFMSTAHSPFWDLLLEGLKERATKHKGAFEIHFAQPREDNSVLVASLLADITAGNVAGIISIGLPQEENALLQDQVPLVAFASGAKHIVRIDELDLMRQGVSALVKRGCQRLELWADLGPTRFFHQNNRRQPLREVLQRLWEELLEAAGLPYSPSTLRDATQVSRSLQTRRRPDTSQPSLQERGFSLACQTFDNCTCPSGDRPDGIVVLDDMMTRGALVALGRLGLEPGKDVHIATHSNAGSDALLGYEDKLIRIEFQPLEVATALFNSLDALIAGDEKVTNIIEIQPELIEPGTD